MAVERGLSHKLNASYAQKKSKRRTMAIHFERRRRGQDHRAGKMRRPNARAKLKGQAKQKMFPAARSASIVSPRQCVHGSTPARFIAAICGPNKPSITTTRANENINS